MAPNQRNQEQLVTPAAAHLASQGNEIGIMKEHLEDVLKVGSNEACRSQRAALRTLKLGNLAQRHLVEKLKQPRKKTPI